MQTKNIYTYPVEREHITRIITTEAPAHISYTNKEGVRRDLTNAIDFLCENGTPVKAALDGVVIALMDNVTRNYSGYKFPSEDVLPENELDGNYVIIQHENGEYSIYSHLGYKEILVEVGQKVSKGDLLGYVRNTGWSIGDHLHFMVFIYTNPPSRDFKSLEIRWDKK